MSNFYLCLILILIITAIGITFFKNTTTRLARFVLIAFVIASASGVVYSTESYKGWPTQEAIKHGRVKGIEIVNPDVKSNGHIYVWVYPDLTSDINSWYDSFLYKFQEVAPRNYILPYSKKAAKKYADAKQALSNGDVVEIEGGSEDGASTPGSASKRKAAKGSGRGLEPLGEDTSSGAAGDTGGGVDDDYRLKITPAENLLKKFGQ